LFRYSKYRLTLNHKLHKEGKKRTAYTIGDIIERLVKVAKSFGVVDLVRSLIYLIF